MKGSGKISMFTLVQVLLCKNTNFIGKLYHDFRFDT